LGEVSARIYFGNPHRRHFAVRETLNFEPTFVPNSDVPKRAAA
jgi:hypothetical protein